MTPSAHRLAERAEIIIWMLLAAYLRSGSRYICLKSFFTTCRRYVRALEQQGVDVSCFPFIKRRDYREVKNALRHALECGLIGEEKNDHHPLGDNFDPHFAGQTELRSDEFWTVQRIAREYCPRARYTQAQGALHSARA